MFYVELEDDLPMNSQENSDVKLSEYREWRKSMRNSQMNCIFSDNGNCQECLDFEDDDKQFRRHFVCLDIEKFQVRIFKDAPTIKVKIMIFPYCYE